MLLKNREIDILNTDLRGKQESVTGGASSITSSNLTANRALVSNANGKVAVSAVTAAELGCLDGVTGNVQAQINNLSSVSFTRINSQSDPGAYKTGNYMGWARTGSVDSVWVQFDGNAYQAQIMMENITTHIYFRVKHVNDNWSSKQWTKIV